MAGAGGRGPAAADLRVRSLDALDENTRQIIIIILIIIIIIIIMRVGKPRPRQTCACARSMHWIKIQGK